MPPESTSQLDPFLRGLRKLDQVRRFPGSPVGFWQSFLESMVGLAGARLGVLLRKGGSDGAAWQRTSFWPTNEAGEDGSRAFLGALDNLGNACLQQGQILAVLGEAGRRQMPDWGLALRLGPESSGEVTAAAFYLPRLSTEQAAEALKRLLLVTNTPEIYQLQRRETQSQVALSHFSSVLDLMALLNTQRRFLAVVMTFVNEIASRHKCDRVCLGWLETEYVRLQAISHTERFEKKMEALRDVEQTMEEALDQGEIVVWPGPDDDRLVTRDHATFAAKHQVKFICSVPLRLDGAPVAVLMCERNSDFFTEVEIRLLGLCAEMAVRRLSELKRTDRWFGARLATASREALATLVGVQHTWAKVVAVLIAVGLGVLFFGRMNYRVEAPFILRTDDIAILSAPFNGFIDEVKVEIGYPVRSKDILLKLDRRELLLEEAASLADLDRYTREAEKSRATNALGDMCIAQAQAEQSRARLELVRYRLQQADLIAPFEGVVVEGDLKKRIAAPVRQGDLLFKVARTDRMYVECSVKENDIHEVRGDATGEIAFTSQPKLKFPMRVERIEPVAQTKELKNIFIVRCQLSGLRQNWWRPGMSGVAKLSVGKRTFFWIVSHRTVDFLRMYFWL